MTTTKLIVGTIIVLTISVVVFSMRTCRTSVELDSSATGATLMSYVKGIEGNAPEGRRQYIKTKLKEFDVPFSLMPFDTILRQNGNRKDSLHGENIIVSYGTGK